MIFFNFLNIFAIFFFWNFLARVGQEWNSRLKYFSLFLGLSHPGLDRNNNGMMLFNFLDFFAISFGIFLHFFFWNFLAQVGQERNLGLKLFSLFLGLCQHGLDKNNAGMIFFNFLIFLEVSFPGRVGTEFGTKIFFSLFVGLSHPRFGQK